MRRKIFICIILENSYFQFIFLLPCKATIIWFYYWLILPVVEIILCVPFHVGLISLSVMFWDSTVLCVRHFVTAESYSEVWIYLSWFLLLVNILLIFSLKLLCDHSCAYLGVKLLGHRNVSELGTFHVLESIWCGWSFWRSCFDDWLVIFTFCFFLIKF